MKKILLLTVMCVLGLFGTLRAQESSFSYNFDDGSLTGWRTFTGTGNVGNGWQISPEVPSYYPAAYHTYYKGVDNTNAIVSLAYDVLGGTAYKPNAYVVTSEAYVITEASKLSWYAKVPGGNATESEHYYLVVSEDNTNWTSVFDEVCPASAENEYSFAGTDYVGKTLYIGFHHLYTGISANSNDAIVIDNIVLTSEEESEEPGELTSEFFFDFNDGIMTGWTAFAGEGSGNAPLWEIGDNGNEGTYAIQSMSFHPITWMTYASVNNYIVTENPYQITENSKITWYVAHSNPDLAYADVYELLVSTDGTTFEKVWEGSAEDGAPTVSLSEYAGQNMYIGFRHYCTDSYGGEVLTLDDITLTSGEGGGEEPEPAAPATPVVAAAATGETAIVLTWEAVENATSYNVYYGEDVIGKGVTETTYTVEELTAGTNYCFTVTALNGELESEASEEACATTEEPEPIIPDENKYRLANVNEDYTVYSYASEKGTKVVAINIEGVVDSIFYDADGRVVNVKSYGEEGVIADNKYVYENGLLVSYDVTAETWQGSYTKTYACTYDDNGKVVMAVSDEDFIDFVYDENGTLVEKVLSFGTPETPEVFSKDAYTYEDGKLVKIEYFFAYSEYKGSAEVTWELSGDEAFEYDAYGNCVMMTSSEYGSPWMKVAYKHNLSVPSENVFTFKYPESFMDVAPTHANMLIEESEYYSGDDFTEAANTTVFNYEVYEEETEEPIDPELPDDVAVLISDDFNGYEAEERIALDGNAWWTTWSKKPGSVEDGVVKELDGNKCGYLTSGVDQVLLLGDEQSGVYDLEFDILVPDGKTAYFNILHDFKGTNSTWAAQVYIHMTDDGTSTGQKPTPGSGTIHAGSANTADFTCVYNEWMHFRLHVDTDADVAQYYLTLPGAEEVKVCEWQWSLDSFGESTVGRKIAAMNFFPPLATSEYYLDNFSFTRIGGESTPGIAFDQESLSANSFADDVTSVELSFENTGTSITEYTAWIDYGMGNGGNKVNYVNYDQEPSATTIMTGVVTDDETPFEIELGVMFPAESYGSSVAGTHITHLQYPFVPLEENNSIGIEEGTPVTFRIYGQGLYGKPGEILAEKVLSYEEVWASIEETSGWALAEFDEPVALTGYNVWATVSFSHAVSSEADPHLPLIFDGVTPGSPYGDLLRLTANGEFYRASELFGKEYGNLHLRMVTVGNPVLGGWAALSKVEGVMPIGATETITVDLTTIGLEYGKTYEADIVFSTNVPEKENVKIPVSLYIYGEDVEEILCNAYNVYPNPTIGQVTIEGENINYVAVYNSVGQLVKVVKNQNNIVDMSAYENGVYYFSIVDNNGQNSVQRVVVAK